MKFLIITNVIHTKKYNSYYGYGPYISEINIWLKYIDQLIIVAPIEEKEITPIDLSYDSNNIVFRKVPDFSFTSIKNRILSVFKIPFIFWKIFWAMYEADHIHLRCPGNMGLLACFVQILFPHKIKTAKYAGNWDPHSKQPWTYRLQKYILRNTFLTKNMTVLVYGDWANQTKNIKPFFTATYSESEKEIFHKKDFDSGVKFLFVGGLTTGKNPLYAVKIVEQLLKKNHNVTLEIYGEGFERNLLENYINDNKLNKHISLKGNQNKYTIKEAYKESHFVILPSKSEGWPKAVAEGMFWGCIPLATKVSCIPYMLDNQNRGIILYMNLELDILNLENLLKNKTDYKLQSKKAMDWSRKYTVEIFQEEIKKILS